MTEAELIELINKKRNELEDSRSRNVSSAQLKTLEDEIKNLEAGLSKTEAKKAKKRVFLDECAG